MHLVIAVIAIVVLGSIFNWVTSTANVDGVSTDIDPARVQIVSARSEGNAFDVDIKNETPARLYSVVLRCTPEGGVMPQQGIVYHGYVEPFGTRTYRIAPQTRQDPDRNPGPRPAQGPAICEIASFSHERADVLRNALNQN